MTAPRDEASEAQVRAADPATSTWLAANAGSGKTRVLTDRVARLLLRGIDPQQILCLTYTKAAASEMQNRLFERLGKWAMQPDEDLRQALWNLGEEGVPAADDLAKARTLFARAIETPGGLKIQTIHSFCSGILRRFPLEAGVSPLFQEMEDRAAQLLQADIVNEMVQDGQANAVHDMALFFTSGDLPKLLSAIVQSQEHLSTPRTWAEVADSFGINPSHSEADLEQGLFLGDERALLEAVVPALMASDKTTDTTAGAKLSALTELSWSSLAILEETFLTQSGTLRKNFPTKGTQAQASEWMEPLWAFMQRVEDARAHRLTLNAARKTQALYGFSVPFLNRYKGAKQLRGWLDFDDLILRTRQLLSDDRVAAWVLYRLDGGIGHILVDEAQDTSPAQWDVVRLLTQEFTSGQGSRDALRTLFVVGDKKQSIYSFQGARPDAFDQMEVEFGSKLRAMGARFAESSLEFSFRSSDAILQLVDATFEGKTEAGFSTGNRHRAFHGEKPGRVDLWPVIEKRETKEDREWTDPIDLIPETHHTVVLAREIALNIKQMLRDGTIPEKEENEGTYLMRPIRPADILILVQRRSRLFEEIIRACKSEDLPIAGSDRLRVGAELAVRDLLALLAFLSTPEDSLSLAAALRSPLFGWSEQDLFTLAHHRKETHLWEALREKSAQWPETYDILKDLRARTDFLRPYDLLERILTRHHGRKKLLSRLGQEAEDGIDALLTQALGYERTSVPSLTGFLTWAQADDLEIKRQVDSSGDLVRVMTVHGAKGLEAPIVFLPDCGQRSDVVRDDILRTNDVAIWKVPSDHNVEAVETAIGARKIADAQERLRLLYVAMTRAETWLIVAAAGDLNKDGSDWYQTIKAGMTEVGASEFTYQDAPGLRYEYGNWTLASKPAQIRESTKSLILEPYFDSPIPDATRKSAYLTPSDLEGAKALPSEAGLDEETAKARGTYVHLLLEVLGAANRDAWPKLIESMRSPPEITHDLVVGCLAEAQKILSDEKLHWIFESTALAEVTLTGSAFGQKFLGTIDRLVITDTKVTAIDFKTNVAVPEKPAQCPKGILRQLGVYAELLKQQYPDRDVEIGILWTATATYMSLPHDLVTQALLATPRLDDSLPST